jgi:prolyl oligopeptidase
MPFKRATLALSLIAAFSSQALAQSCPAGAPAVTYPASKKVEQQDNYHGTMVADPYRWLEDANSEETKAWVVEQNKVTQSWLAQIPQREAIKARLTKLWNYERYSVPSKKGGRYFYSRNDGLQNQAVLYTAKTLAETPRVLLDPNTLAADGTVALAGIAVSPDGKFLAYSTAASGSDWNEIKVRDITTGKDMADHIKWVKFSNTAWAADGSGFYYSRYDEPSEATKLAGVNYFQKVYFHKLGTAEDADVLVYHRPDQKEWGFGAEVTDDGRYLVINGSHGTEQKNRVFIKDLKAKDGQVTGLLEAFDASYSFIDNEGPLFYPHRRDHRQQAVGAELP